MKQLVKFTMGKIMPETAHEGDGYGQELIKVISMRVSTIVFLLICLLSARFSPAAESAPKPEPPSSADAIIKQLTAIDKGMEYPYGPSEYSPRDLMIEKLIRSLDPKDYLKAAKVLIPKEDTSDIIPITLVEYWGRARPEEAALWLKTNAPYFMDSVFVYDMGKNLGVRQEWR